MNLNKVEQTIINKLSFNENPTYSKMRVPKEVFMEALNNLESKNLLFYERIEDGIFKGEPGHIYLTELGKSLGTGFK
ncbi:hypothetical protein [Enterococcus gallinarum]|uniref:hypothetical protein n=1 Tax=Enterococcus gallinarum TaxID=1353 RepID=UPI0015C57DEF|nr:hypothetical protein [Enterococcus gallinarum]NQE01841.1 hypothetical protein [Enterococcus gallinarum]